MSSTNRGTTEKDHDKDNWETPHWAVNRLAEELWLPGGQWLEPCAGNGRIIQAVYDDRGDVDWTAVELRPECLPELKKIPKTRPFIGNFLEWDCRTHRGLKEGPKYFDVVLTNPPFSKAFEILSKCLVIADHVVILQRLNWLGSGTNNGKNDFLRGCMPDVYVVPDRIKFMINGEFPVDEEGKLKPGDSIEYAWFYWGPGDTRFKEKGEIRNLRATSLEERKRG